MIGMIKQKRGSRYIGGIKVLAQRCQLYLSLVNFLMILTLYYLKLKTIKLNVAGIKFTIGSIPFWAFLLILVGVFIVVMIIDYIYILPSEMSFIVWQQYLHRNPIVQDINEIKEIIKKMDERIKNIEEKK